MLPLRLRQDKLGCMHVRSHSASAQRLTEWGLPALAFLEYRAIGPWGPTESFQVQLLYFTLWNVLIATFSEDAFLSFHCVANYGFKFGFIVSSLNGTQMFADSSFI